MNALTRRAWPTAGLGLYSGTCALAQSNPGASIRALVFPTAGATPFYYAFHDGLFQKAGLTVAFDPVSSGNIAIQAVVAGAAQIGIANTLSLAQAHLHGIPVVVLCGAGFHTPEEPIVWVFVQGDSPLRTARDLEGRTVAVTGLHDTLALSVRAWIAQQGADSTKIRFVEIGEPQMQAALQQGRVDAIVSFEPYTSAIVESGFARVIATPYDAIAKQFSVTVWFAYGPWVDQNRDQVARLVSVMRSSSAYVNGHFTEVVPIAASYMKLPPEIVRKGLHSKTLFEVAPSDLQPVIDSAARFGELSASFAAREMLATLK